MNRHLIRFVAVLVIPCLAADPVAAFGLQNLRIPAAAGFQRSDPFNEQALIGTLVAGVGYSLNKALTAEVQASAALFAQANQPVGDSARIADFFYHLAEFLVNLGWPGWAAIVAPGLFLFLALFIKLARPPLGYPEPSPSRVLAISGLSGFLFATFIALSMAGISYRDAPGPVPPSNQEEAAAQPEPQTKPAAIPPRVEQTPVAPPITAEKPGPAMAAQPEQEVLPKPIPPQSELNEAPPAAQALPMNVVSGIDIQNIDRLVVTIRRTNGGALPSHLLFHLTPGGPIGYTGSIQSGRITLHIGRLKQTTLKDVSSVTLRITDPSGAAPARDIEFSVEPQKQGGLSLSQARSAGIARWLRPVFQFLTPSLAAAEQAATSSSDLNQLPLVRREKSSFVFEGPIPAEFLPGSGGRPAGELEIVIAPLDRITQFKFELVSAAGVAYESATGSFKDGQIRFNMMLTPFFINDMRMPPPHLNGMKELRAIFKTRRITPDTTLRIEVTAPANYPKTVTMYHKPIGTSPSPQGWRHQGILVVPLAWLAGFIHRLRRPSAEIRQRLAFLAAA